MEYDIVIPIKKNLSERQNFTLGCKQRIVAIMAENAPGT